jgi:uncharacterized phage protein (TIGR02218 family)
VKSAGTNTLAALQSGQVIIAELYDFALANGQSFHLADYDVPLTVGSTSYATNATLTRGSLTQTRGMAVQTLELEVAPQNDSPTALVVSGLPFLQAVRAGLLYAAKVTMWKVFMRQPASGLAMNTNDEAVQWFLGKVSGITAGRLSAKISIASGVELLNVQMPRNLIAPACAHQLFDVGCGLSKASYTTAGTIASVSLSGNTLTTNLTAADAYYDLGSIVMTSGYANGQQFTVQKYLNSSGSISLITAIPQISGASQIAVGDTFNAIPNCDRLLSTCKNKFNNVAHNRGFYFVPQPETLYSGGISNGPAPQVGSQGGGAAGSQFSGRAPGAYRP